MLESAIRGRLDLPPHWIGVEKGWDGQIANLAYYLMSLPPIAMRTHVLIIGSTGCGKTNLNHHLIAQDIMAGHSFVILDRRGDAVTAVLELCAGRVDPRRVRVIDLREKVRPFGFNPLSGQGESYIRAHQVLEVIATVSESFGVQLADTLRNGLMLLIESDEPLTQLERLFYDGAFRASCIARSVTPSVSSFWERFGALSPDRQSALAMPVMNKVSQFLSTGTLRRILGHPRPIDLARHLNTPGSILLISLAGEQLYGAATMMGTLILSSICREIFARVDLSERSRNPVRMYVDEFEHFPMADFETVLAEGRRFGLSVVLSHQTLAQLSPKMRSIVLNNVGVKVIFRTGHEDASTLSRDLTGDAKALPITDLAVGEALLWQRGQGVRHIEINEPILTDVGSLSRDARLFREAVHSQTEVWNDQTFDRYSRQSANLEHYPRRSLALAERAERVPAERESAIQPARKSRSDPGASLEDWLCG